MDEIHSIAVLSDNYSYVLSHEGKALVIDPGEYEPILKYLEENNLTLTHILCTHHHSDHIAGMSKLLEKYPAEVIGPNDSRISSLKKRVKEGDLFEINSFKFAVFETPGHTKTHVVFYLASHQALFSGDTLFGGGCGRLFEGTPKQMWDSLEKIKKLPDDTKVYFGHEYTLNNLEFAASIEPGNLEIKKRLNKAKELRGKKQPTVPSTLSIEKATNPFLRVDEAALKQSLEKNLNANLKTEVDIFAYIRKLKDSF